MLSHHARWPGSGSWNKETPGSGNLCNTISRDSHTYVLLWVKKTRWWGALLGTALHVGISVVTRDITLFCLSMIMTYLAFLRKEDVDVMKCWMKRWWKRGRDRPS